MVDKISHVGASACFIIQMCGVGFSSTADASQHFSKLNVDAGRSTVAYLAPEQVANIVRLNTFSGEVYRYENIS